MSGAWVPPTHDNREPNWRRIFCWWWGHEYYWVGHLVQGTPGLACLRCFGASHPRSAAARPADPDRDGEA